MESNNGRSTILYAGIGLLFVAGGILVMRGALSKDPPRKIRTAKGQPIEQAEQSPTELAASPREPTSASPIGRHNTRTDTLQIADVPAPGSLRARPTEPTPRTRLHSGQAARLNATSGSSPSHGGGTHYGGGSSGWGGGSPQRKRNREASNTAQTATHSAKKKARRGGGGGSAQNPTVVKGGARYGKAAETTHAQTGGEDEQNSMAAAASGFAMDGRTSPSIGALNAARGQNIDSVNAGSAAGSDALSDAIYGQLAADQKLDDGLRGAADAMRKSGKPVTRASLKEAAGDVLGSQGLTTDDVDLDTAVDRALSPQPQPVSPTAVSQAVQQIMANPPSPERRAEILAAADNPPPTPRKPAPRGALDAYRQYTDIFRQAEERFGVAPHHILGILGVETRWGRITGDHLLKDTLTTIAADTSKPKRAAQATRDLSALSRLAAQGELGGPANSVAGSYAGAMGIPQFLPSSWEAYARDADGGGRDPYNFPDAIFSVANYLKVHGYQSDVSKAVWGYNHSQEYVDKVLTLSEDVKASLAPTATGN
jgi:membrane-bound lytic murein transglycosylase B